jgi:hypothetical protein
MRMFPRFELTGEGRMHNRSRYRAVAVCLAVTCSTLLASPALAADPSARYRLTFRSHLVRSWDAVDLRIFDVDAHETWLITLFVAGRPYPPASVEATRGQLRFLWALPHGAERRFEVHAVDLDDRAVVSAHVHRTWNPPSMTDAGAVAETPSASDTG